MILSRKMVDAMINTLCEQSENIGRARARGAAIKLRTTMRDRDELRRQLDRALDELHAKAEPHDKIAVSVEALREIARSAKVAPLLAVAQVEAILAGKGEPGAIPLARTLIKGCERDNDFDGNCPRHPKGCPVQTVVHVPTAAAQPAAYGPVCGSCKGLRQVVDTGGAVRPCPRCRP